jgi:hypothetical protein|tara:strand:+ start:1478 stop:2236 length:759 start_codon:yes stop_codon:yes gene_type:complete
MFSSSKHIKFSYPKDTHELFQDIDPVPISKNIPDWYKKLKHTMGKKTIKGCMPFLDSLTAGYLLKTPQDIVLHFNIKKEDGERDTYTGFAFSEVESLCRGFMLGINDTVNQVHPVRQLGKECPYNKKNKFQPYIKIINPIHIETPPGYSCLFLPPLHSAEDRFQIIPGIVDTDSYPGNVNFPLVINGSKYDELNTIVKRGTPYVQIIPFKRDDWTSSVGERPRLSFAMGLVKLRRLFYKNYQKLFWHKKKWN